MKPKNAVRLDRTIGRQVYAIHLWLYRVTGGRIGHKSAQGPMLLLTTTGRKSGQPRTHPLLYMPDGDDCVVVGSNGGRPEMPQWVLNLKAKPECKVQAGRRTFDALAEVLDGDRKTELWPRVTEFYKGWEYYTTLTERDLPVVVLRPSPAD
jgi:deazaflavin-dependent oxidoreductase (nitroreductase family)